MQLRQWARVLPQHRILFALLSSRAQPCDQEAFHSTPAPFQQRVLHILTLHSSQLLLPVLGPG